MQIREFRERWLAAAYMTAVSRGFDSFCDAKDVADTFSLERARGQLRLIVDDLDKRGYITLRKLLGGGDEGELSFQFTSNGLEAAEDLIRQHPSYKNANSSSMAPGADRYVHFDHNARQSALGDLAGVREAVRGDNDADPELREIALSEIAAFEATIVQPRVSTELIDRFVKKIVDWLIKHFTSAALGVAAKALIEQLIKLVVAA
jgi:hypothetical protein